jgi:hypothetical protein
MLCCFLQIFAVRMIKFKFFALLVSVQSLSRDPAPKCFVEIDTSSEVEIFGDLRFISSKLEPCLDLIIQNDSGNINNPTNDCSAVLDDTDASKTVITCAIVDNTVACPDAPRGCDLIPSSRNAGTCVYSCKDNLIGCPNEIGLKFPFELKVDEDNSWCFETSYSSCVIVEQNYQNSNQERQSCTYYSCGFKEENLYSLTFTKTLIINTYDTENTSVPAKNVFQCDTTTNKTPSGCSCTFDGTSVTVMKCSDDSYTDLCIETDCEVVDTEKNDSVCYKVRLRK